jgi:predicted dehydrogenase
MDCLHSAQRKAIYVDKPLTNTLQQAMDVLSLAREMGQDAQVIFEVRYCPALQYAYKLIKSGRLGELYSFRGYYYRSSYSDPAKPLRWKASAAESGTGALGDLAAHVIDLISWLAGNPVKLSAQMRTFVNSRPEKNGAQSMSPVETDDHVILLVHLANGAIGTLEAGRMITGAMNDMGLEIYGSKASLRWNLMDANNLYLADQRMPAEERGWLQIPTLQRYPEAILPGEDVPAGLMRYHIASAAHFVRNTLAGQTYEPGLLQGAQVQAVIEAAQAAVRFGTWQDVPQLSPSSSSLSDARRGSVVGAS